MENYNRQVIIALVGVITILVFTLVLVESIDFTWATIMLSVAASLLSSLLFFIVFRHFDDERKKENDFNATVGINSKMEEQYWIDLIKELPTTNDDVIFYGYKMSNWCDRPIYKTPLIEKLKNKKRKTKVYFILYNTEYYEKWKEIFKTEKIDVTTICKENQPPPYSIVCCDTKISIVLRINDSNDDRIAIEIPSRSNVGKLYTEYVKQIIQNNKLAKSTQHD